ncbi:Nucleolar protein 9 [Cyphellophora attinorum]|uniref:Nucleolar protein 9 n=1 Tax=Cyphellophora attinorum TaxID=1664694 RepID=A0A0N0NJV0_9EURO|nr:Nucleolar protein 9 [Phialophora attinorum]KPI37401.1 Nucleolar protein 9 [Phialophora attinorum]
MPRTKKKRGKFEEKREKRQHDNSDRSHDNVKRRKLDNGNDIEANENGEEEYFFEDTAPGPPVEGADPDKSDITYYGLLTDEESTYYANVNAKVAANDFEDEDDRTAFIDAVYRESRGKEMKLASSQSSSRHLEQLLKISNSEQLKNFFAAILEGLVQLMQHRFGSHVCETVFLECGKHIDAAEDQVEKDGTTTMTGLFLRTAELLEGHIAYMLTDRFASHTIRVLLLVLSGEPLDVPSSTAVFASRKRQKDELSASQSQIHASKESSADRRKVPKSFSKAMSKITSAAVAGLDPTYLRSLGTHPTGNPVLQILLQLELSNSDRGRNLDKDSLFNRLIEPDQLNTDSEGAKFISSLTYDPTGSRLIEIIVRYSPAKTFKKLYQTVWQEKIRSMARNDLANFVAIKVLERIGKDDLEVAREQILLDLQLLIERRRFKPLAKSFKAVSQSTHSILQDVLYPSSVDSKLDARSESKKAENKSTPRADTHGSLLAQSMIAVEATAPLILDCIAALPPTELVAYATDPAASRLIQAALTPSPTISMSYRKLLVPKFTGHIKQLSTDSVGLYVVEALWPATNGAHFMKERIAKELADSEEELRDSYFGRRVWRMWQMDVYIRSKAQWQGMAKGTPGSEADNRMLAGNGTQVPHERKKKPIELARERWALEQAKKLDSQQEGAVQEQR